MNEQTLSVVIVNYNGGELLRICLDSLLRSNPGVQVVLVDNASTDCSLEGLESLEGRIELIRNNTNLGFARAVNLGAELAGGKYLALLNPDCLVAPGSLECLRQSLDEDGNAGIAGGLVVNPDGSEQRGCRRHEPALGRALSRVFAPLFGRKNKGNAIDRTAESLPDRAQPVDAVSGAYMLIRKSLFDSLGGLDEGYFLHCEDLDICRRVRDLGFRVLFEPNAWVVHQKSASAGVSRSQVEKLKHQGMIRYFNQHDAAARIPGLRHLVAVGVWCRWGLIALLERLGSNQPRGRTEQRLGRGLEQMLVGDTRPWLVIAGASSQIGDYLLKAPALKSFRVLALTRGERRGQVEGQVWWVCPRFADVLPRGNAQSIHAWIHLAPIWLVPEFAESIQRLAPARIVAVGSSSIVTKAESTGAKDRHTVRLLKQGEAAVMELARQNEIRMTLFRPTMIYGNTRNTNIAFIEKFIRRFHFFPVVGQGAGRRQPVHAGDVADAVISVLNRESTFGKIYPLPGGEVLSYASLVGRVFDKCGLPARILKLPKGVFRLFLSTLGLLPGLRFLSPDMAERQDQHLDFDYREASLDFDYEPRKLTLSAD